MNKLQCVYEREGVAANKVVYIEGTQPKGGDFTPIREVEFDPNALPQHIQMLCLNYGLRAILADRTSDAKARGVNKLEWMESVYDMFMDGQWKAKVARAGGIARELVELVVQLKGCTAVEAEAALKQTTKEWRADLAERYADQILEIKKELATADAVDLADL